MAIDDPYDEEALPEDGEDWPGEPDGNAFIDDPSGEAWETGAEGFGEADPYAGETYGNGFPPGDGAAWDPPAEGGWEGQEGTWEAPQEGGWGSAQEADAPEGTWDEDVAWPAVEEEAYLGRAQWPDAAEEDFLDDAGDWTSEAYEANAHTLFGWREDFGRSVEEVYLGEGYTPWRDEAFAGHLREQFGPGTSSLRWYEKGGAVAPRGFLDVGTLASLAALYPLLDVSRVHVTVPSRPEATAAASRPLPESFRAIQPADGVDLRRYCGPVGDQGQTSRCAAFAWTHALELLGTLQAAPFPPLSCSFTMFRFQQRQGDARDFAWAWKGGDGTQGTWEPGQHLLEWGTCRQELWPDDRRAPTVAAEALEADARAHTLAADTYDIGVEDLKKVLTAGFPVQLSIATGEAFQDIGPDGVMKAAEKPSGEHGYHAMLCVGYVGNYFILKNSWGEAWGDKGYCYVPKKVLAEAEPQAVAIVPRKPRPGEAPAARTAPVRCGFCGSMVPPAATCPRCKGPLRQEHRCPACQAYLPPGRVACPGCGAVHG